MRFLLGFSVFFYSLISSFKVSAESIVIADLDGSILEYRSEFRGTFETTFKFFRIEYRSTLLEPVANGPEVIEVTAEDRDRLETMWGKGNNQPGSLQPYTLQSGQVIIPGQYMLRDPDSFVHFFEAPNGRNYLLEDFKRAEKKAAKGKGTFKGPFWDHMVALLSTPETAKTFGICSARAHSINEWRQFFAYLQSKKYIRYLPNFDLIFGISRRDFDRFSLTGRVALQKRMILDQIATQLGRIPLTDADLRLDPNGEGMVKMHSLIFAEDWQGTVESTFKKFRALALSKNVPVKFLIFNAGERNEVVASGRAPFLVVTHEGASRPATLFEQVGELPQLKKWASRSSPRFCHALTRAIFERRPKS